MMRWRGVIETSTASDLDDNGPNPDRTGCRVTEGVTTGQKSGRIGTLR